MSYIDLITPIDTLIGAARHGKLHQFTFVTTSSFPGTYKVEKILRRYGIRIWGRKMAKNQRSFLVKQSQAIWAEYILCRAGVPLISPLLDPRNVIYPAQHPGASMPTPWTEKGIPATSFVDHLCDWLAKLFG